MVRGGRNSLWKAMKNSTSYPAPITSFYDQTRRVEAFRGALQPGLGACFPCALAMAWHDQMGLTARRPMADRLPTALSCSANAVHANLSTPLAVAFHSIGTVPNGFNVFSCAFNCIASRQDQYPANCENCQKLFHSLSPTRGRTALRLRLRIFALIVPLRRLMLAETFKMIARLGENVRVHPQRRSAFLRNSYA